MDRNDTNVNEFLPIIMNRNNTNDITHRNAIRFHNNIHTEDLIFNSHSFNFIGFTHACIT